MHGRIFLLVIGAVTHGRISLLVIGAVVHRHRSKGQISDQPVCLVSVSFLFLFFIFFSFTSGIFLLLMVCMCFLCNCIHVVFVFPLATAEITMKIYSFWNPVSSNCSSTTNESSSQLFSFPCCVFVFSFARSLNTASRRLSICT